MGNTRKGTRKGRVKHMRVTAGPPLPLPWWERWVGTATGHILYWLAVRAAKRRDWHEFNHLIAALHGGNSDHRREPCGFPSEAHHRPLNFVGGAVALPAGDDVQ